MSDAYYNALKRKKELLEELAKVETFLELFPAFNRPKTEQIVSSDVDSSVGNLGENPRADGRRIRPAELADIVERMIREIGHPMTRGEIVEALEQRDVILPAKDKARYVGTILWREGERFINVPKEGYVAKDMIGSGERAGEKPTQKGGIIRRSR